MTSFTVHRRTGSVLAAAAALAAIILATRPSANAQDDPAPAQPPIVRYEMATVEPRFENTGGYSFVSARICYFVEEGCRFQTIRRRDREMDVQEAIASGSAHLGSQGYEPVNAQFSESAAYTIVLFKRPVRQQP